MFNLCLLETFNRHNIANVIGCKNHDGFVATQSTGV